MREREREREGVRLFAIRDTVKFVDRGALLESETLSSA